MFQVQNFKVAPNKNNLMDGYVTNMYSDLYIFILQIFCVILDMMSVCFVDPSAIKTLIAMYKDFKGRGILFCLADCSGKI
jgi:hypothetical protein